MKKRVKVNNNLSEVTLTLEVGKPLSHESGHNTDEGFNYIWEEYTLTEDGHVKCTVAVTSLDCDGRLDTYDRYISTTPASNLETMQWERIDGNQYDYTAAAAGY